MGIEVSKNEEDQKIAQEAAAKSFGIMNYDEFGYSRYHVESLGVDAAKIGAEVTLLALREMGVLKEPINTEVFKIATQAVHARVHKRIMSERFDDK